MSTKGDDGRSVKKKLKKAAPKIIPHTKSNIIIYIFIMIHDKIKKQSEKVK